MLKQVRENHQSMNKIIAKYSKKQKKEQMAASTVADKKKASFYGNKIKICSSERENKYLERILLSFSKYISYLKDYQNILAIVGYQIKPTPLSTPKHSARNLHVISCLLVLQ